MSSSYAEEDVEHNVVMVLRAYIASTANRTAAPTLPKAMLPLEAAPVKGTAPVEVAFPVALETGTVEIVVWGAPAAVVTPAAAEAGVP